MASKQRTRPKKSQSRSTGDKLPEELGELQKEASLQAVRGGGEGDVSKTHVLWLHKTKAPSHIVSPLVADGRMFLIKQGGITASFDIAKGAAGVGTSPRGC
jgi:hypothetical protein